MTALRGDNRPDRLAGASVSCSVITCVHSSTRKLFAGLTIPRKWEVKMTANRALDDFSKAGTKAGMKWQEKARLQ
jgi:hypothetical protein